MSLRSRLSGKLKLTVSENARHTDFRLTIGSDRVPLPNLIRLSRGSGDLKNGNVANVAKALGLNEHELHRMVGCSIGRECVLLCLTACLVENAVAIRRREGAPFDSLVLSLLESAEVIAGDVKISISIMARQQWSTDETAALERAIVRINEQGFPGHEQFQEKFRLLKCSLSNLVLNGQ